MLYMCKECGGFVKDPKETKEKYECEGKTYYVTIVDTVCPHCGSEMVETYQCEVCGKIIPDDGDTICPECKAKIATYDNACELGDHYTKTIEINGFVASLFEDRDIEDILFDELGKHYDIEEEARKYFEADETRYQDYVWLAKKRNGKKDDKQGS